MRPAILLLSVWSGLCAGRAALANLFVVASRGDTPVPVQEADVALAAQTVRITEGVYEFRASCTFVTKSLADKPLTRTVAFPVGHASFAQLMAKAFKVTVDGAAVETRLVKPSRQAAPKPILDSPGLVLWEVTWQPGQSHTIACACNVGRPEHLWGLGAGRRLVYAARTGARWKGKIGKADISVAFRANPRLWLRDVAPKAVLRTSYPEQAKWASPTEVRWHFENWEPTDDLVVEVLAWRGLGAQLYDDFLLPYAYAGAASEYTDATLEALVERETAPWAAAFPRQVKALDRKRFKRLIADLLHHEILARHGDPFLLGRDPTMHGRWRAAFAIYSRSGGWYKPDRKKTRADVLKELNATETRNLAFLKAYVDEPTRRLEAYRARIEAAWPGAGKNFRFQKATGASLSLSEYGEKEKIRDLAPLKGLELAYLNLRGCKGVSDLAPLHGMPLTSLNLSQTAVADLTPLKGMRLTELDLTACTRVKDLSPLAGMPLRTHQLSGTAVADLAPLQGMPLRWLDCRGLPVADLAPLKGMPLTYLDIRGTKVADLSPLAGMPLRMIALEPATIRKGIDVLRRLTALRAIITPRERLRPADFWKTHGTKAPE